MRVFSRATTLAFWTALAAFGVIVFYFAALPHLATYRNGKPLNFPQRIPCLCGEQMQLDPDIDGYRCWTCGRSQPNAW